MWKNMVEPERPQIIQHDACVLSAGHLRLQIFPAYVTLTALRRQHTVRERASVLRYTYIACLFLSQVPQ